MPTKGRPAKAKDEPPMPQSWQGIERLAAYKAKKEASDLHVQGGTPETLEYREQCQGFLR